MKSLGVISENTLLSEPTDNINRFRGPYISEYTDYYPWEPLSEGKKDSLDLEMAVFAAMVDRMDRNIGRVLSKLEEQGVLENTLIMFLADNGSCPYYSNKIPDVQPGPANSYWSLRSAWANAGNTPYRYFKQYGHEGGSHTPFIACWPGMIEPGSITDQVGHVVDIAPTLLDILGTEYPDTIQGYPTIPMHGSSLLPVFKGKEREEPSFFISGLERHRMFRMGAWKIARVNGQAWELYNVQDDPSETTNLAETYPVRVKQLGNTYEEIWEEIVSSNDSEGVSLPPRTITRYAGRRYLPAH